VEFHVRKTLLGNKTIFPPDQRLRTAHYSIRQMLRQSRRQMTPMRKEKKKFPRANGLVDVYDKFYIIRLISRRTCGGGETVSSSTTTNRPSVCAFSGFCSESSEKIFHSVHASARNFAILHDFPLSFWRHPGPGDYRVIQLYETFVLSPIRRTNPGSLILLSFMPLQIAVTPAPDTCSRGANINSPRGSEIRET
jgi:hypothetical protein